MITFSQLGQWGRLGNQLFEIATTVALALKNNDIYGFPNWEHESFFNLKNCFYSNFKIDSIYQEPYFHYKNINYVKNLDLKGYFQSYKYFDEYKYDIFNLLTRNLSTNPEPYTCGIHVRRGDYLNLPGCYTLLGMDYYKEAMNIISAEKYIIFSDDIEWCKNNFIGEQFEFSKNQSPYQDLTDMSKKCDHMIIANSSFSWWGAYLNNNLSKKVIAPKKWFGPKLPHDIKDLLPTDWILI